MALVIGFLIDGIYEQETSQQCNNVLDNHTDYLVSNKVNPRTLSNNGTEITPAHYADKFRRVHFPS